MEIHGCPGQNNHREQINTKQKIEKMQEKLEEEKTVENTRLAWTRQSQRADQK